jgi:hypothetical protein
MIGHGEKKSRKLDAFVANLLLHPSVEEAARATGISVPTGFRWMKDAVVLEKLRTARRDAMNRAIVRLQEAASGAVDCLCKVQREGESESARVSAARCILEQALRAAELGDIEERLAKLETIAKSHSWKGAGAEHSLRASGKQGVNSRA